jgi:predicted PurR-regulated permease PerM
MSTARWFFILLAIIVSVLMWEIISPFVLTLITAGVAAIIVSPLETRLRRHVGHPHLSAFVMTVLVFFLIFIPLLLASIVMVQQVIDLVRGAIADGGTWPTTVDLAANPLIGRLPDVIRDQILAVDFVSLFQGVTVWFAQNIGAVAASTLSFTAKFFLNTVLFFISLYYFLSDREKITKEVLVLSPLKDTDDRTIIGRIVKTVRAVVFGSLTVATVQGIMAAIGMAIFGVPGFLVWGALTIVASQVPLIGVSVVMVPAVLYLVITGSLEAAIGLAIWAGVMVGLADNLLSPFLIKGKTNMHALLILLSILGAIQLFGPIGLVIGPTVLAAFLVVVEMYKSGILEKHRS